MCDSHPVPKVFISLRLLLLRYESYIPNPTFPFLFIKRKTHPVSLRNERHILFPIYTLPVFQNNSFWVGKVSFFTMVHTFSFISLMSEYVSKTQTLPFLFLVFHFEAKDTPSPMVLLPFHLSIFLLSVSYFLKYHTSLAHFPFLNLLLLRLDLLLLAFRDGRNKSMLTQSILPSSFIFIQKQKTYPIPKLYPFF